MTARPTQAPERPGAEPLVAIVDADTDVRQDVVGRLRQHGFACRPFRSAADLLDSLAFELPDCILLGIGTLDQSGLAVLAELPPAALAVPVIVMTSRGELSLAVEAMTSGAVDIVEKPISVEPLAEKIRVHIERSAELRRQVVEVEESKALIARLTPREKEVAARIVDASSNKEIARDLDISPRTVEVHRAKIFKKLEVRNAIEAAQIFERARFSLRTPS